MGQLLTLPQVAKELQVTENTLRIWARDGYMPGWFKLSGRQKSQWRIDVKDFEEFKDRLKKGRGQSQ